MFLVRNLFCYIHDFLTLLKTPYYPTLYSGIAFYKLDASRPLLKACTIPRIVAFLARMISFQGLQWIFGLIHYATENEIMALLFEIFGSFEGAFIFASLIGSQM